MELRIHKNFSPSLTPIVGQADAFLKTDQHDTPLLARSASVREPSKPHPPNMSPVGGLIHQGKLDPEQSTEKSKQSRDPKRRTVQVEYVAPQSQTTRGDTTPSVQSPVTVESSSAIGTNFSKTRARAGTEALESQQARATSAGTKPLPKEPAIIQTAGTNRYQYQPGPSRAPPGSSSSQQAMAPPPRPPKEIPRSASDSVGAFGPPNTSITARPNTSGSMASTGPGRLPSRGNSYSQPLAPTVAATNAQGRLAQPKNGKQYISAPIPQSESYFIEQSIGRPSTQRANHAPSISSQRDQARGHKRSNTFGNVIAKSGSLFGRSQAQPLPDPRKLPLEKRYPPTSMKAPIASDSPPRPSIESRRSTSFGFGRKNSNLQKNNDAPKQEKPRRFSLLPASFSFKSLTGASKDVPGDSIFPASERRMSTITTQPTPPSRGQSRPQTMATTRDQVRSNSYQREEAVSAGYDGQRERNRDIPAQQARRNVVPHHAAPQAQQPQSGGSQYLPQQGSSGPSRRPMGQSYLLEQSGTPTDSEVSLTAGQHRPIYPPGFDSYDDEPRASTQQSRSARVLQKNNRRFADAYEHEQEPGYGTGGHHAGSSGAAKRVMDFFRRRGKARAGDDRV